MCDFPSYTIIWISESRDMFDVCIIEGVIVNSQMSQVLVRTHCLFKYYIRRRCD